MAHVTARLSRGVLLAVAACGNHGGPATGPHDGAADTAPRGSDATIGAGSDAAAPPDAAACPATSALSPGDTTKTITVDGVARTYLVHVPATYTGARAVPLVIDLHPKDTDAATWVLATPWTSISDQQGFILVRPNGYQKTWNAGRCCDPAMSAVDDVAFVRAMVTSLEADACIEVKRIYATGCSNGGGMAYKLACDAADVIAAVAPVDFDCITGPTNSPSCGSCSPSRPISEAQFRGVLDPFAPYYGGPTSVVPGLVFPGAAANFATWGTLNQCTGQPQQDPAHTVCQTYPACGGSVETTLCTNPVGLHCTDYSSFHTAEIAWEMFSRQKLP
jgi:polyhydroxybutyrate depolymerase